MDVIDVALEAVGIEGPTLADMLRERAHDFAEYLRAEGEAVSDDDVLMAMAAALRGEHEPIRIHGPDPNPKRVHELVGAKPSAKEAVSARAGLILTDIRRLLG